MWRHPSELSQHQVAGASLAAGPPVTSPPTWSVALAAGLAGVLLSTGAIALTGQLSTRVVERPVVEKVAVTPVVSSPMVSGERGVVAVAEQLSPAIVRLDVEAADGPAATGSGVLYRDDGLLLTSAHLLGDAVVVDVELTDGRRFVGELIGRDPLTDIALVRIDATGLPVAVLGTAEVLEVGAPTIAIGSPLVLEGGPSVTTGIISAVNREVKPEQGEALHGMIQTDAPIAPGSSGGALVDANGAVIGITTAVTAEASGRFGFATPIDLARRVADHLLLHGRMVHGWLGVEGTDLTSEQAASLGVRGGALVRAVAPGSPAAPALAADDVITQVDGQAVRSISALVVALRQHGPGDEVRVGYWRDGARHDVTVTLAERP